MIKSSRKKYQDKEEQLACFFYFYFFYWNVNTSIKFLWSWFLFSKKLRVFRPNYIPKCAHLFVLIPFAILCRLRAFGTDFNRRTNILYGVCAGISLVLYYFYCIIVFFYYHKIGIPLNGILFATLGDFFGSKVYSDFLYQQFKLCHIVHPLFSSWSVDQRKEQQ